MGCLLGGPFFLAAALSRTAQPIWDLMQRKGGLWFGPYRGPSSCVCSADGIDNIQILPPHLKRGLKNGLPFGRPFFLSRSFVPDGAADLGPDAAERGSVVWTLQGPVKLRMQR